MPIKNILKKILAVILFNISFLFLICVIVIIAVPDTDGMKAIMIIVLSLFCIIPLLLGIKLIKTRGKNKSTPVIQKVNEVPATVEQEETEHISDEIPIEDAAMEEVLRSKKDNFSEIIIYYSDASGNISAQRITNLSAYTQDGEKYIKAYCHMKNALRTFRLDRIEKLFLNGTESNKNEFYDMLIKGHI